jgi:LemA protein
MLWLVFALIAVAVVAVVVIYNGLVQLRVRADSAWSDIDVQLKRRYDLIPNLVETVKGYAAHEKSTFENVTRARNVAMGATTPAEKGAAEAQLTAALKTLFAVAENYPQLRASEQFTSLQGSLNGIEESRTPAAITMRWCATSTPRWRCFPATSSPASSISRPGSSLSWTRLPSARTWP